MAESSVQSAVQWLGILLQQESQNLTGIHQKLEQLRDELDWMQCFLREADRARYTDLRIRRWVAQIQEIAYEAEDIVQTFLYKLMSHQIQKTHVGKTAAIKNKLERYLWVLKEAKATHDAANSIETLRAKISTLTSRLQAYGIKITRSDPGSLASSLQGLNVIKDERFVGLGLDDHVKLIVAKLVGNADAEKHIAVGIWGKDGVGKSTLARKIYHTQPIRKHFERFAWVYVPQNYKISSLLRRLFRSLSTRSNAEVDLMGERELIKELNEVQQEKKCVVVLDNVWNSEIWDAFKAAFPGEGVRDSRSMILFTTHCRQVAEHITGRPENAHEMKCLSYDESWELLRTKMGAIPSNISANDGANKMMEMAKKMLKPCQGVPLAIVTLGGLLATRKTLEEWQTLLDLISGKTYEKVLELCFYSFPSYLKNCFLYLGSFPEDSEVSVNRLRRLWVAEGIVTMPNGEAPLEEFPEHCISELLQRGMVQVAKRGHDGSIKSCCLHYLMRDLCLKVLNEENFLTIIDSDSSSAVSGKVRRLALHLGGVEEDDDEISLPQKNPLLRSLLLSFSQENRHKVSYASVKAQCWESQFLRVLDLEGIGIGSNIFPREIGYLMYLRYLNLKDMAVTKLPPSIGNLRWLETLDLRVMQRVEIPNVLWRLERLRHLYLPQDFTLKDSEKLRLDNLKQLLTLKNLNYFRVEDVLGMKNLKKASLKYMPENQHLEFIQRTPSVVFSLTIFRALINENQVIVLQNFSHLIKLELKGCVKVPITSLKFPPNLKKVVLDFCGILEDPMPVFEKLPALTSLCFDDQAYMGKRMVCSASGFPKLTHLRLNGLKNLEEWGVEQGSMLNLLHVDVKGCERLAKIPEELPHQVQVTHI